MQPGLLGAISPEEQRGLLEPYEQRLRLADVQRAPGAVADAFGQAGRAGLEGYATALSGVDAGGRTVGGILPMARDERTGERSLAAPRILDLWNTVGGVVPGGGAVLGAGPVVRRGAGVVDDMPEQIASLLRQGRAAEVTDDMLGALGPNGNRRLYELYESGATGMDLPMDEASRMARAREMGFGPDLFHGTADEFPRFDIDMDRTGAAYDAAWLTDDASLAFRYGSSAAGHPSGSIVRELQPRLKNPMTIDMAEFLRKEADNVGIDPSDYDIEDLQELLLGPNWKKQTVASAADAGHDGLILKEFVDMPGGGYAASPADVYAVFDPANIRDRQARFDPRLTHNADLLASRAAPGGLLAAPEREQMTYRDIEGLL